MKHINSLLIILTALFCSVSVEVNATQYCEAPITLANPNYAGNTCNFNLTCQKIGNDYIIVADITSANYTFNYGGGFSYRQKWRKDDNSYYEIPTYFVTSNGNKTVTITFPWEPQFRADGSPIGFFPVSNGMGTSFTCGMKEDVTWGTCAPPDTHDPVISSVVAQSTTQTSIVVRVTATDNQTNDSGVASITVTRRGSTPSQTQNYSPAEASISHDFEFSGLSAGRTYTFDVTVTDAAGRTASTSQNLSTQPAVVDNTPPSITSAAAENIKATTADIRVQATDNIGVTRVVIKNGDATIKDESISSTASLNQAFTLTGLTKNTTYGNIKVIVYDASSNASSTYNVASFTTKDTQIIYFVKSGTSSGGGWGATPKVHFAGGWETSTWPGVDMTNTGLTNCDGTQIWRAEIPSNTTMVVFNNGNSGSGNQSSDQTPLANQYFNWERNTWYSPENLYILGNDEKLGNWTRSDAVKFSTWGGSAPTSVTKTLRLTGSTTYQFKIQYYDGANEWWRGNNGTMESNNCTKWLMDGGLTNCQIHTTTTGNYTFTYDFTANKLSVTYPVPDVGCEGTSTTCTSGGNNFVHYTLKYISGNIVFSVRSTTANALQTCKLNYAKNTNGQDAVNNVVMTITDGEATYTLPATGAYASGTMYFYFTYQTPGMGSEGSSASGFSSGAFQYNIGGCPLDDGIPYMLSVSKATATSTSVTLNVNGVVNVSGVETSVDQYRVSINGGTTYTTYTATAGQVTIPGLSANTEYNFIVQAYYESVASENSKSVLARTKPASQCSGTRGDVEYTIGYDDESRKMTISVESKTSNAITALRTHWLIYEDLAGGYVKYHNPGDTPEWATVTDGVATAEYTLAAEDEGRIMLIRLGYNLGSGEVWTANDPDGDKFNANNIFYIVGECPAINQEQPQMSSASTITIRKEAVDIHLSSRDNRTRAADMIYHVNVQSTTGYDTEWNLTLSGRSTGDYTLRGLVPDVSYRVTVYCEDEDGYLSTADINPADRKQKVIEFTTTTEAGCSSGADATEYVDGGPGGWGPWGEGMTYELQFGKVDGSHINIIFDLSFPSTVELGSVILERHVYNPNNTPPDVYYEAYLGSDKDYVTVYERTSTSLHIEAVIGSDLPGVGDPFWSGGAWNTDNDNIGVKVEWHYYGGGGGPISAAGYYSLNPSKVIAGTACRGAFIITQSGRAPSVPTLPTPVGDEITFDEHILYYRQFTPGQWEPFVIPFEVSSVEVYDPDENEMFELTPQKENASGYYLLRQQVTGVSGEVFQESWYDGTDDLPQKNTPYNIYFPAQGGWRDFYTKKYVLFRGTEGSQTVASTFSKGSTPTGEDKYTLYGNNTLSTAALDQAYQESSDGKYYVLQEDWTLQPFECYVLASGPTMRVMRRIGPWMGDTPTAIDENSWAETVVLKDAEVYDLFGQLLLTEHNRVFYDLMQQCAALPAGCYIIKSELGTKKIVVP